MQKQSKVNCPARFMEHPVEANIQDLTRWAFC